MYWWKWRGSNFPANNLKNKVFALIPGQSWARTGEMVKRFGTPI